MLEVFLNSFHQQCRPLLEGSTHRVLSPDGRVPAPTGTAGITWAAAFVIFLSVVAVACSDTGSTPSGGPWHRMDFHGKFTVSLPADFTFHPSYRNDVLSAILGNRDISMEMWYGRNLPYPYPDLGPGSSSVIDGWRATLYDNIITQGDTLPYTLLLRTDDMDTDHLQLQVRAFCRTESNRQTAIGILRSIRFSVRKHGE